MTTPHEHEFYIDPHDGRYARCDGCGQVLEQDTGRVVVPGQEATASRELAVPDAGTIEQLLEGRELPVIAWAQALMDAAVYEEGADSNPTLDIIAAILGAQTSAEALAATSMRTAEDLIGTEPGAHSPVLTITGASPLKSTFTEGPSCFSVVSVTIKSSGEQFKLTIGARAVQAAILAHIYRGWMPFDAILTRRLKPTRKGFYPLNLEAGG